MLNVTKCFAKKFYKINDWNNFPIENHKINIYGTVLECRYDEVTFFRDPWSQSIFNTYMTTNECLLCMPKDYIPLDMLQLTLSNIPLTIVLVLQKQPILKLRSSIEHQTVQRGIILPHQNFTIKLNFYRPETKSWEGNVFTGVCLSTGRGGVGFYHREPPWQSSPWTQTPPPTVLTMAATAAGGTHPTGILTCVIYVLKTPSPQRLSGPR